MRFLFPSHFQQLLVGDPGQMGHNPWGGTPAGSPPRVMGHNQISGRQTSLQSAVVANKRFSIYWGGWSQSQQPLGRTAPIQTVREVRKPHLNPQSRQPWPFFETVTKGHQMLPVGTKTCVRAG